MCSHFLTGGAYCGLCCCVPRGNTGKFTSIKRNNGKLWVSTIITGPQWEYIEFPSVALQLGSLATRQLQLSVGNYLCTLWKAFASGAAPLPPAKAQRSGLKKLPGCKLHLRGGNLVANLFRATLKMASVAAQCGTVIGMSINQSSSLLMLLLLLLCLLLWRSWRNAASASGWRGIHQRELIRAEQMKRQPKNNDAASLKGSSERAASALSR